MGEHAMSTMVSTIDKDRVRRIPVIYILGDIRSGSSLLERTLTACDTTVATGEQRVVWKAGFENNNLCSCGVAFSECDFWTAVRRRVAGYSDAIVSPEWMTESLPRVDRLRLMPAIRQPRLRSDSFSTVWEPIRRSLAAWYAAIYLESGERVIIDSSKSPAYGTLLGTIPSLNVVYIHLAATVAELPIATLVSNLGRRSPHARR